MSISAIYNTGIYNQSYYGRIYTAGSSTLTFELFADVYSRTGVSGTTSLRFTVRNARITFTNSGPFLPTWNGQYYDLETNTDPSGGYLDLLYEETSGSGGSPFKTSEA